MKMILLFSCVITLITTTGCLVDRSGRRGPGWHDRADVIVAPPVVEVRPPEVIVR
jgi:hypothetical protein